VGWSGGGTCWRRSTGRVVDDRRPPTDGHRRLMADQREGGPTVGGTGIQVQVSRRVAGQQGVGRRLVKRVGRWFTHIRLGMVTS
jgi:hypothetical protein